MVFLIIIIVPFCKMIQILYISGILVIICSLMPKNSIICVLGVCSLEFHIHHH